MYTTFSKRRDAKSSTHKIITVLQSTTLLNEHHELQQQQHNNNNRNEEKRRHSIAIQVDASLLSTNSEDINDNECGQLCHQWFIDDNDVPNLPEIYPRISNPLIFNDTTSSNGNNVVDLIGQRLCDFLQSNDIRFFYDKQRGRFFCSNQNVSFVVQFWRTTRRKYYNDDQAAAAISSTGAAEEEQIVILEIQRRQGCSYTMHKIRSALKKSVSLVSYSSSSSSSVTNNPIIKYRHEKLFQQQQSYRPSSHIKRMHHQKCLSAPPRLLAQPLIGIDKKMFYSLSSCTSTTSPASSLSTITNE